MIVFPVLRTLLRTRILGGLLAVPAFVTGSLVGTSPAFAHASLASPLASAQRGEKIFQQVCSACHGMERVQYGDLLALVPDAYKSISAWAKSHHATLASPIASPYPSLEAGKAANGGDYPPDLSVIARTIRGGPLYIEHMLADYRPTPPGVVLGPHEYYNPLALTHHRRFRMPPPLQAGMSFGPDGQEATVSQMARDVTAFLVWSADPHAWARHFIGWGVLAYLALLTAVIAALVRSIWRRKGATENLSLPQNDDPKR